MLEVTIKKHIMATDLFRFIQKNTGIDVEGEFNEIYCPPQEGAVEFWIPDTDEEFKEREDCEKLIAVWLMQAGFKPNEHICLDFDY